MKAHAFLSYQTADKLMAAQVKNVLAEVGISSFLAHEDIGVSEEWRVRLLEEIAKADIFVCLLSKNYFQSPWCVQESGIAAFRAKLTVIPLSLDGSIPQGFLSHVQSVKVNPTLITLSDLVPGLLNHDFPKGIEMLIDVIGGSRSFRGAEEHFELILPFLGRMTDRQIKRLLEASAKNNQVHHASLCAREYLPPLLSRHGHLLEAKTRNFLRKVCAEYLKS